MGLYEYIQENAVYCEPEKGEVNLVFFGVQKSPGATKEGLLESLSKHKGVFCEIDPLDGKEHSYPEVGAWMGDQEIGLRLMGLGHILGLWKILTPYTLLGKDVPQELVVKMVGIGFISIQAS